MKLDRIGRRLRKEAAKSPGKAAVLALLVVIAIWHWLPLVWGWIVPDEQHVEPVLLASTTQPIASTVIAQPEAPAAAVTHRWPSISALIERDQYAQSVELVSFSERAHKPFHWPWIEIDEEDETGAQSRGAEESEDGPTGSGGHAEDPPKVEPSSDTDQTPKVNEPKIDTLLLLTATIVGPRGSTAMINHKSYREGEIVSVPRRKQEAGEETNQQQAVEFRLIDVHPEYVLLQREGKIHELSLPEPESPMADLMVIKRVEDSGSAPEFDLP